VTNYSYAYDFAGNRLVAGSNNVQISSSYNALNQLESGASTPTNTTTYEWDAENRLTAINQGTNRNEFYYDGHGRRVETIIKTNDVIATQRYMIWDGDKICECWEASDNPTLISLFPQGESRLNNSSRSNFYYNLDHLRSMRELTDTNGIMLSQVDYGPFGSKLTINKGSVSVAVGFAGYFQQGDNNFYQTLYRIYSSDNGRWLSREPLGIAKIANTYTYCENNPINSIDRLGLWTVQLGFSFSYQIANYTLSISGGVIVDNQGNFSTFNTGGIGDEGLGFGGSSAVTIGYSTADTIYNYEGPFVNDTISTPIGSAEYFTGHDNDGNIVSGQSLSIGPGGFGVSETQTETFVNGDNSGNDPSSSGGTGGGNSGTDPSNIPPTPPPPGGGSGCDCGPLCDPNNSAGGGGNPGA
jgi:RHS repeat-associated protein